MRKYLFTVDERRRLRAWLDRGEEGASTRKLFTQVRRSLNPIKTDVELLSAISAGSKTR